MKKKSFIIPILFFSGVLILFMNCDGDPTRFGPIRFERYRTYFSHSTEGYYALSKDINNSVFDKYTVGDTKFILVAEPYRFFANREEIKDGIAGGKFGIHIYTKKDESVIYRLLKTTIKTSSYSMDIFDFEKGEANFDSEEEAKRSDGYKWDAILSNYYRFSCPEDMKYSITVFIEEEKSNGIKIEYEFTYYFYFEKKDNWFRLLS